MSASYQHDLISGVVARVFAHELRPQRGVVPCWSYVTDGLRAFGQHEMVLTIVRPADQGADRAPGDPLGLLRTIAGLAQQGRLVDAGGFTEVGPSGLFGRPQLRGLAYQTAAPMDGVTLPPGCLAAIVLVGDEMEVAKRFGALRVLARLGRANNFWPTTPWCEPDRGACCAADESILGNVASAAMPGVSAVLEGDRVTVRIARSTHARFVQAGLPPPETALALLTVLDDHADACLVWFQGQPGPEAISAPNSRGARVSGCFIAFVPQQEADGADTFEDGFAARLTDASWLTLRDAILRGTAATIPGATGKTLVLEWFDAPPPRSEVPAVSEMQMQLREGQDDIEARLGMAALVEYANTVEATVQQYYAGQGGQQRHGQSLEIQVLLAAGQRPAVYGELDPALYARLAELPGPPVRSGEVAFRGTFALFGGAS
ncbi:MAG: hypothetical protein ABI867_08350 [Kofleriaceae bacterium]